MCFGDREAIALNPRPFKFNSVVVPPGTYILFGMHVPHNGFNYAEANLRQFVYIDSPFCPRYTDATTPISVPNDYKPSVSHFESKGFDIPAIKTNMRKPDGKSKTKTQRKKRAAERLSKQMAIDCSNALLVSKKRVSKPAKSL